MTARVRRAPGATDVEFSGAGANQAPSPWLRPADLLVILISAVLIAANSIVWPRVLQARGMIAADLLLIALVLMLRHPGMTPTNWLLCWLRDLYIAPVIYLFYLQSCLIARPLHHGRTYDTLLVAADRWLFGLDPTRWLAHYTNPFVTEVLQLAYASFYLLFLLVTWDLLSSGKRPQFEVFSFGVVYGFALSYLGYWLLPSVGPRFLLHRFSELDSDLPGLALTPYLRAFVNWGGSIAPGANDQAAMAQAFPDVFPSGHVMMTVALIFWSFKFSSGVRWLVLSVGSLLIASTVYLRYHYVIDVLAGGALAFFCLASYARLYELARMPVARLTGNLERSA